MKKYLIACTIFMACSENKQTAETVTSSDSAQITTPAVVKEDIRKIKWIEGKWKGMYKGKPFYEIYEIINDSLKITGYEWNGTDSLNSSIDYVAWNNSDYFLGKDRNYKVTMMSDTVIRMIPVKANNDITWRYRDTTGWDAILVGKTSTNIYNMERFDPFKK